MWTLLALGILAYIVWTFLAMRPKRARKPVPTYDTGLPRTLDALREKRAHDGEPMEDSDDLKRQREAQQFEDV